jgi:hypothetical protein
MLDAVGDVRAAETLGEAMVAAVVDAAAAAAAAAVVGGRWFVPLLLGWEEDKGDVEDVVGQRLRGPKVAVAVVMYRRQGLVL